MACPLPTWLVGMIQVNYFHYLPHAPPLPFYKARVLHSPVLTHAWWGQSKMSPRTTLCLSLALCWLLADSFGMALMPKDKRGWTLNSAGYLLGPHAHHALMEKGALAGKREAVEDIDLLGSEPFGDPLHPMDESAIHTLLDSLPYLRLQELGALERLAFPNGAIQP